MLHAYEWYTHTRDKKKLQKNMDKACHRLDCDVYTEILFDKEWKSAMNTKHTSPTCDTHEEKQKNVE